MKAINKGANWQESLAQVRDLPTEWNNKFTEQDKQDVARIIEWLNNHKKTATWLAAAANINRTTMQLILQGTYAGRVSTYVRPMLQSIKHIEARKDIRETPFIASSVSKLVWACCQRARKYKSFGVITAEVGLGKTRALLEYADDHDNTLMIDATPMMSPTWLLDELVTKLNIQSIGGYVSRERKFRAIIEHLKGTDVLLVLDEAETVNAKTLEHIRRIRDLSNIGVVLTGTPKLHTLISPIGGQFDQIRSRTCYWPKPVRGITEQDAKAVLVAAFEDQDELDSATLKAFWHHAKGSMRMLVEDLIPAVRDYGLKKHPMSADLVHAVAKDVLSLH